MKQKKKILLLLIIGLTVGVFSIALAAGGFDIPWSSIDGGGGQSSGGAFALNGSVGQADASATTSGGSFSVQGGFWGVVDPIGDPTPTPTPTPPPGDAAHMYLPVMGR